MRLRGGHPVLESQCWWSFLEELSGEAADGLQVRRIGKVNHQFLDAGGLVGGYALTDRLWAANESRREEIFRKKSFHPLRKHRLGLLIGLTDTTHGPCRPMNAVEVASGGLAMPFEYGELVPDGRQIARHVTGICVLRDQFERDLFTVAPNQQGNMRVLHPFGLIDGAMCLIIVTFKNGFFLLPHRQYDLDRFAQLAQTLSI